MKKRIVWVVFSESSGAVQALYFREPKTIKTGYRAVKTALSEQEINRPHYLKVVGETVFQTSSLAGI